LDNARFHRRKQLFVLAHQAGVFLVFLPAYLADYNCIEKLWVNMKWVLVDLASDGGLCRKRCIPTLSNIILKLISYSKQCWMNNIRSFSFFILIFSENILGAELLLKFLCLFFGLFVWVDWVLLSAV